MEVVLCHGWGNRWQVVYSASVPHCLILRRRRKPFHFWISIPWYSTIWARERVRVRGARAHRDTILELLEREEERARQDEAREETLLNLLEKIVEKMWGEKVRKKFEICCLRLIKLFFQQLTSTDWCKPIFTKQISTYQQFFSYRFKTTSYDLHCKYRQHFQSLEEYWAAPAPHNVKCLSSDGTGLFMVPVEPGFNYTFHWLPVGCYECDGSGHTGIATIPENTVAFWWV